MNAVLELELGGAGDGNAPEEKQQDMVLNKHNLAEAGVNFEAPAGELNKKLLEVYAAKMPVLTPKGSEKIVDVYRAVLKSFRNGLGVEMKLAGYYVLRRQDVGIDFLDRSDLEGAICAYVERVDIEMKKKGLRTNYDKAGAPKMVHESLDRLEEGLHRMYV